MVESPQSTRTERTSPETRAHYRQAVAKAVDAMHRNVGNEFTLQDMADEVYISPFHFNRIFRQTVGVPPRYFLSALRIQSAKRLLMETDEKVIDICFEVGFSSVGTFSRRFKALVGVSPQNLRRAQEAELEPLALPAAERPGFPHLPAPNELGGWLSSPPGFDGPIFVGLFDSPVPQGAPASCCLRSGPGKYLLCPLPDGWYYLLAAAYHTQRNGNELLLGEVALRAGSARRPVEVRDGGFRRPIALQLRPPKLIDPPILVALPLLLQAMVGSRSRAAGLDPGSSG